MDGRNVVVEPPVVGWTSGRRRPEAESHNEVQGRFVEFFVLASVLNVSMDLWAQVSSYSVPPVFHLRWDYG